MLLLCSTSIPNDTNALLVAESEQQAKRVALFSVSSSSLKDNNTPNDSLPSKVHSRASQRRLRVSTFPGDVAVQHCLHTMSLVFSDYLCGELLQFVLVDPFSDLPVPAVPYRVGFDFAGQIFQHWCLSDIFCLSRRTRIWYGL